MAYERDNIKRMSGYTPGEQPESLHVVKLNTNENPYPPCDSVIDALRGIKAENLRRYPSPTAAAFRKAAAEKHGLEAGNIIATNGGDELLRLAITTFVDPGQSLGVAEPSYSLYQVLAEIQGCHVEKVPLNTDWSLPDDFARRLNRAGAKIAILVNPHAPSGYLTDVAGLSAVASEFKGVLLVDEAYADFVDPEREHNTIRLIEKHENVMVLRSLSKGYSLAGLRFGYGIGPQSLMVPMLEKTKDSYNVSVVAQTLAVAALESRDKAGKSWDAVRSERKRLRSHLAEMGISCPESQSNFLLATVPEHIAGGAAALYASLKDRDIFVRYFDTERLRDKIRITIGTPEQNRALIEAMGDIIG